MNSEQTLISLASKVTDVNLIALDRALTAMSKKHLHGVKALYLHTIGERLMATLDIIRASL